MILCNGPATCFATDFESCSSGWKDSQREPRQVNTRLLAALFALVLLSAPALADSSALGVWATEEEKSHVEIYTCGEQLCGRIIWLNEPLNVAGTEKLDINNEDESMRERPIVGLEILTSFVAAGEGKWKKGRIYNPEDGDTYKSVSQSTNYFGRVIRTLAPHWGLGVGASSRRSTYLNLDNSYRAAAAVEYNIFPYSESSEREFTFAYFIGGARLDYEEVTVYDKLSETFADQGAFIAFGMERPWGEAHVDLQYSHFLDDFDRSRIEFSTDVEYRILRGLSFDVYAGVSRIRDQIYLPKGGASDAEVLVARRQLETDLTFRGGIQLRYTFGSIYNNVVNSRLSSESGGFSRIF